MQAIRVIQRQSKTVIDDIALPFRSAGPTLGIGQPATALWLTRAPGGQVVDAASLGPLLQVVLSGLLTVTADEGGTRTLGRGDLLYVDVQDPALYQERSDGETWRLLVAAPSWRPEPGTVPPAAEPAPRPGRPLMNWMYDNGGRSRSEPFRWPGALYPVPPVEQWPRSDGFFLTRRVNTGPADQVGDSWHRGPRRMLAVTLSGSGENETGDGTCTQLAAGDFAFVEDTTGEGHRTRGEGDRRMLYVTVADGSLELQREECGPVLHAGR